MLISPQWWILLTPQIRRGWERRCLRPWERAPSFGKGGSQICSWRAPSHPERWTGPGSQSFQTKNKNNIQKQQTNNINQLTMAYWLLAACSWEDLVRPTLLATYRSILMDNAPSPFIILPPFLSLYFLQLSVVRTFLLNFWQVIEINVSHSFV